VEELLHAVAGGQEPVSHLHDPGAANGADHRRQAVLPAHDGGVGHDAAGFHTAARILLNTTPTWAR
jgi:hypothetical protein